VTPFDPKGKPDPVSTAKLLAWFEAAGCSGAVLAGTNGEGPSLSPVEKRDLIRDAMPLRGKLDLILGIATSSSDEAVWLCKQAAALEATAVLLMAPYYFREASEDAIRQWFEVVLDRSPTPVLVYNFPQRTGVTLTAETMAQLAKHETMAGAKDSSGSESNIADYKQAIGEKSLFVGNETLLLKALEAGWSGSISGAANVLATWLCQIYKEWTGGDKESAETKFQIILPLLQAIRSCPQPATNKALLARIGVIADGTPRLPLVSADPVAAEDLSRQIQQAIGLKF